MRNDEIAAEDGIGVAEVGREGCRVGRTRVGLYNRRRLGVVVMVGSLAPWLPLLRPSPSDAPPRCARGSSGVPIIGLAFAPDGRHAATTDEFGYISVRDVAQDWNVKHVLKDHGHEKVVAFAPDGRSLVAGGMDADILRWELDRAGRESYLGVPVRETSDLKFSPDGRMLAISSFQSSEILLWDLAGAGERMTLKGHSSVVVCLVFAPDGRSLASAGRMDRTICIWDLSNGRQMRTLKGVVPAVIALAYSPDGRWLVTASGCESVVRIWDVATGEQLRVIAGHDRATHSMAFSPDGRLLLTGAGDGTVGLWDAETGREVRKMDSQSDLIRNVALAPDGRTLAATGNDQHIRLWDLDQLVGADFRR